MIFQNASLMDCLFTFEKLLFEEQKYTSDIYRLLAFTGIAWPMPKKAKLRKPNFISIRSSRKFIFILFNQWRYLASIKCCLSLWCFYAEKGDLETSDALFRVCDSICSDNHVTYYLQEQLSSLRKMP